MNKKEILINADWQRYCEYYHYVAKKEFVKIYRLAESFAPIKNRHGVFNYVLEVLKTSRQADFCRVYKLRK